MRFTHLLSLASFILTLSILPKAADAKCCYPWHGLQNMCYDGSWSTPCCGWGKCSVGCCHCEDVRAARIIVWGERPDNGDLYRSYSTLTASAGVTWHCRDNMERWMTDPERYSSPIMRGIVMPTATSGWEVPSTVVQTSDAATTTTTAEAAFKRDASAYITAAPTPVSDFRDEQHDRSQCDMTFEKMSRGNELIDLEGYLAYFGASLLEADVNGTSAEEVEHNKGWGDTLIKHYGKRDVDGDGFLSREEADALI